MTATEIIAELQQLRAEYTANHAAATLAHDAGAAEKWAFAVKALNELERRCANKDLSLK